MMDAGTCSNVQGNIGGPDDGGDDKEDTRRFIIQVKEEMERCLEAGMSKEQMFRELREKGLHVAIAFAVYKELRDQNYGFFEEYYGKIDVRKQTERFQRLLHQYRTARDAAAGVSTLLTATPPTAMAVLENMGSSYDQTVVPVGLDDARLVGISSGDGQFAGSEPLQQAVQLPDGEQLHQSEHWVPNGGVRGVTSAAGPSNAFMTGSWPPPRGGLGQWHAEQGERLQRWLCCASADPSLGLYDQPPLSGEEEQLPP